MNESCLEKEFVSKKEKERVPPCSSRWTGDMLPHGEYTGGMALFRCENRLQPKGRRQKKAARRA